jgi:hypothetical protein
LLYGVWSRQASNTQGSLTLTLLAQGYGRKADGGLTKFTVLDAWLEKSTDSGRCSIRHITLFSLLILDN